MSGPALEAPVTRLNPYLVDGPSVVVEKSGRPLSDVPEIHFGNMPLDGGHLLMTPGERDELLRLEPQAAPYIRPLLDAQDFLNGGTRYCLWLEGIDPSVLRRMPRVLERVEKVRVWRLASIAPSTQRFAVTPSLFRDRRLPERYLIIPSVTSERREYAPVGYLDSQTIVNNLVFMVPDATPFLFGVLSSKMHMAWLRYVGGRLESRYRYSKDIVYNTFPFPTDLTPKLEEKVEAAARAVLEARAGFPQSSLADLYDPLTTQGKRTKR